MKDFVFPPNTRSIGESAFCEWWELTEFTIPEGVETIGDAAIGFCGKLAEITIPGSITSFADGALQCCSDLKTIHSKFASDDKRCLIIDGRLVAFAPAGLAAYTIPEGVKSIGVATFYLCDELKELTIPESVESIGRSAFAQCGLKQINIWSTTPPAMEGDIFGSVGGYSPAINVPESAVDTYKNAEGWKKYAGNIRSM